MNPTSSGVQFLDSAKAIKLVFNEFDADFSLNYFLWTTPYNILENERGSINATFNKINLIVKL